MNSSLSYLGTRRLVAVALFATTAAVATACGASVISDQSSVGQPPPAASTAPATSGQSYGSQAPPAASTVPATQSLLGATSISVTGRQQTVLTDTAGRTLYYFTPDKGGLITCTGGCARAWPPLVVPSMAGMPQLPTGVSGTVGWVTSPDGGMQITLNGWPLYRYAGDTSPGQANGEGSGNKWFVAASGIPLAA